MNFRKDEDLFESSRMTFGEHLDELRIVLMRSLIAIAIGCVFGFLAANHVVKLLTQPLVNAIAAYRLDDAGAELVKDHGYLDPELIPWLENEKFVPRKMRVDPAQLVGALRTVIPDFAEKVDLEPYVFRNESFDPSRLASLCRELVRPSQEEDARSQRLQVVQALLTPEERAILSRIADSDDVEDGAVGQVVAIFNRIAGEAKLYDEEAFLPEVTETPPPLWGLLGQAEAKPLAKMKTACVEREDRDLSRRLNRALLTQLFSEQMPELKMDLVTLELWESSEFHPQALGVSETFMVWVKAGILTGLILAGPFVFYFLWSFVAAGLYPHEQKYVHLFLPISIGLFITGVLLAFFFVFQPVLGFLFSFNRSMGIAPEMRIGDWLSFVMFLPLGFGLAFQLPLVMLFMNRIGLFQVKDYLSKWRIAVMVIFVLAMFLTPADPLSMLLLAVPLTLLYFMGIAMCRWMPSPENPFGDEEREYVS